LSINFILTIVKFRRFIIQKSATRQCSSHPFRMESFRQHTFDLIFGEFYWQLVENAEG